MRLIKQTKENEHGISMKDLSFFPSREWGPEGGVEAKVYHHGKFIGRFYNAGDGGEAEFYADSKVSKEALNKFWIAVYKSVPDKFKEAYAMLYRNRTTGNPDDIMMFVDDLVEEKQMTR